MCFEIEGAEFARRTLERFGMAADAADRAAIAIILHMQPAVTLADGVEAVLLDRGTAIDVRGVDVELVESVRGTVTRKFPRGAFDRHFVSAIRREVARAGDCQSARLLHDADLEAGDGAVAVGDGRHRAMTTFRAPGRRLHRARAHRPARPRRPDGADDHGIHP